MTCSRLMQPGSGGLALGTSPQALQQHASGYPEISLIPSKCTPEINKEIDRPPEPGVGGWGVVRALSVWVSSSAK